MFPVANGQPQLSGSYIPMLYATMLLIEFYKATIFGAIATTEFEGQLKKFGDSLRIRTLPEIVINDYVKGQKLQYQTPEPGFIDLLIDKGKTWGMAINLLDKKQSDIEYVAKWAAHASSLQAIAIDSDVLSNIYTGVAAANKGATAGIETGSVNLGETGAPVALDSANIVEFLVNSGLVLDEQNIPDENRWYALPSWAIAKLKLSELKDASVTGDGKSTLRNGRIGMIDRFEIYRSNNLSTVVDGAGRATNAMFGHKSALAFASQMTTTETLKNPDDFGDILRSLQAYGYKGIKEEAYGHSYITIG